MATALDLRRRLIAGFGRHFAEGVDPFVGVAPSGPFFAARGPANFPFLFVCDSFLCAFFRALDAFFGSYGAFFCTRAVLARRRAGREQEPGGEGRGA